MHPSQYQLRHWRLVRGLALAFLIFLIGAFVALWAIRASNNPAAWIYAAVLLIGALALALRAWHRFEMTDDWVRRINNHIYHGRYD